MTGYLRAVFSALLGVGLVACAGADETATGGEPEAASIQLELTTVTESGNTYRLGPATFDIEGFAFDGSGGDGSVALSVEATGDEPALHVPVEPGDYQVTLRAGWILQRLNAGGTATPLPATLLSPSIQEVRVDPFRVTPLLYAFHLGESGIDIGIDVDEGVPPGFDGIIEPLGGGQFSVTLASGGGACCFTSVSEAQANYPDLTLFVSSGS